MMFKGQEIELSYHQINLFTSPNIKNILLSTQYTLIIISTDQYPMTPNAIERFLSNENGKMDGLH